VGSCGVRGCWFFCGLSFSSRRRHTRFKCDWSSDGALPILNERGQVLIAFLTDVLSEPCVVISEKTASRLAGHIIRGEAPIDEDRSEERRVGKECRARPAS